MNTQVARTAEPPADTDGRALATTEGHATPRRAREVPAPSLHPCARVELTAFVQYLIERARRAAPFG